jgi:glucose/arabinose dehydrogenase
VLLAACGGGDGTQRTSPTAEAPATPAITPPSGVGEPEAITPGGEAVLFDFAPDGRIFYTARTTGEIWTYSLAPFQRLPQEAQELSYVTAARRDLAERLDVPVESVLAVSLTARQWPDSCLGAAEPGEACAQVITPGYQVTLRAADVLGTYTYHTDEGTNARFAALDVATDDAQLFARMDVVALHECGLLGIAVDPEFETNHYVYVYATQPVAGEPGIAKPRVIRYTDVDGQGVDPHILIDDLPTTNPKICGHVAGNLHFGPDGYLYLTIGNFEFPERSADVSSPLGKVLRFSKVDGAPAPDNPFVDEPGADGRVYAYGLRNPFDFAFSSAGRLYVADNGPGNCDELNLVVAGGDYGVPGSLPGTDVTSCLGLGGIDPIHLFTKPGMKAETLGSNAAPAGVAFLPAGRYPGLADGILVCEFNTAYLRFLELGGPEQDRITRDLVLHDGCSFNPEVSSDGVIYFSNSDGIFRLPPAGASAAP